MIVVVLTTCHTQCTWDKSICIFSFNRTTLQDFVTYITGKTDPWRSSIERNHMGLHQKNEVARRVASDHHRSHARSISAVNATWAQPHFHRHVREFLNQHLPQQWIGCGMDNDQMLLAWPPHSPDATPCSFFLWGYIKDQIYL